MRKGSLSNARGFTLAEVVAVLVIIGVLAAFGAQMMLPAVQSYRNVRARAEVSELADALFRQLARDVQRAVPNSLTLPQSNCLVLVPSHAGGVFRRQRDLRDSNGDSVPDHPGSPLDLSSGTVSLGARVDILSLLPEETPTEQSGWVVIGAAAPPPGAGSPYDPNQRARAQLRAVAPSVTQSGAQIEWLESASGKGWVSYGGSKFFWVDAREAMVAYRCENAMLERGVSSELAATPSCNAAGWQWVTLAKGLDGANPCWFERITTGVANETFWLRATFVGRTGERFPFVSGVVVDRTP